MNIYLNTDGTQFFFLNVRGERIDSAAGPRDFMIRVYAASGFVVHDERGRALKVG